MRNKAESAGRATKVKTKHKELGLTREKLLDMYEKMLLPRMISERMWRMLRQGKLLFVVSSEGHEATGVGTAYALNMGSDYIVHYYRDLSVVLAAGMTVKDVMLQVFGKADDPSGGGRELPGLFCSSKLRLVSTSSPIAVQLPHAAGIALASKIKGEKIVTITYFGDGATSKGDFHEALNFAGIHKLPVIFVCENNKYAISVPQSKQMAIENVADRAPGYGFPGVVVDGNDVLEVYRAAKEAVERARNGLGPTLIEAKTYRYAPHTSNDDGVRYRTQEEIEEWKKKDPIEKFKQYLKEHGILSEALEKEIRAKLEQQIDEAVDFADKAPLPKPEDALTHVYAEPRR
ncbi:MAG: thiamine pyrophosphate-dependent dehydrogenase E1 component subunit alpha [Chloroflexi bacterium]|nr:thiamine pyrophosphate-dependent dehydrogenase E1 component subunit alpha [Chloroflexota bacterium]